MATVLDRRGGDRPRDARELLCWTGRGAVGFAGFGGPPRCAEIVTDFRGHTQDDIEHGHVYCDDCLTCQCGERMTVWEFEADGCCRECAWGEGDLDR